MQRTVIVRSGFSTTWILTGAAASSTVIIGGLVFAVRKRRAQLQAILAMLFTEVSLLVMSVCAEVADLITDGIVCSRLLHGDIEVSSGAYKVAYITILCSGVVVTLVSLASRTRNARLVQASLQQLNLENEAHTAGASEAQREAQNQEWELEKTHRTMVSTSLTLMGLLVQGARALRAMFELDVDRLARLRLCCRFAHVNRQLLFDHHRRQHRQDGALSLCDSLPARLYTAVRL
jgi:hypothetical protein